MAPQSSFRFVDVFAGIGGMRLGFESVGGECVYSIEWDKYARETYEENFERPEGGDVRAVKDLPDHDVLLAGFPCQPFSIAGVSKKTSLGRPHGFRDQTQGTLFFEIARLLEAHKPPVIVLENVKNLLRHDKGRTFRVILDSLEELDYQVTHDVIDSRPWVAQKRERVFIVGLHRDVYKRREFAFPDRPDPDTGPRMSQVLETTVAAKYNKSEHVWNYLQEYHRKHEAAGNGFGFGLVGPDDVARTLSARYYKDGSEILVRTSEGKPPRMLTPRECARLMGFPETFKITVSDTQAYRQFGNSVVVPVVTFIAKALKEQGVLPVPHADDVLATVAQSADVDLDEAEILTGLAGQAASPRSPLAGKLAGIVPLSAERGPVGA